MKRFVLFASVLVSSTSLLGAVPLDVPAVEEWPKQTLCTDLPALPLKPHSMPASETFKLYVGRIMTLPYTAAVDPTAPNNLCSPLSYVIDSCEGTEIYVQINPDGSKVVKMAAYNKATNNVMCYTQSAELQDEKYHIFKAKVDQMVLIDDKGEPSVISSIPKTVTDLEETMITTLKYGEDLAYAIYASCLKNAAWVAYAEHVVKENLIDGLKEEIDRELTNLGFDPTKFVNVPTSIPINIDKCFSDAETAVQSIAV